MLLLSAGEQFGGQLCAVGRPPQRVYRVAEAPFATHQLLAVQNLALAFARLAHPEVVALDHELMLVEDVVDGKGHAAIAAEGEGCAVLVNAPQRRQVWNGCARGCKGKKHGGRGNEAS